MLLDTDRHWHVAELAKRAGVAAALAHRVLSRLENEGVVTPYGAGPAKTRQLTDPAALLDLWAEEHQDRPFRRPAFLLSTSNDRLIDEICDGLERTGTEYALTGTAAVARIAPLLTNVPVVEVWLNATADPDAVCESLQAQPVESGPNLVILQERNDAPLAFRTRQQDKWIANVFRLYVDVRRDPQRGREQADHLRREVIGF